MPRIPGLRGVRRLFMLDVTRVSDVAIDDELRFHIECRVDDLVASGIREADARRVATCEFGDYARYRDDDLSIDRQTARELRMRDFLDSVFDDARHAVRHLVASPGFALVAIATLALGIGATTAVFSAVRGVLLRPLPYANAN